jgi:hypothetical protein
MVFIGAIETAARALEEDRALDGRTRRHVNVSHPIIAHLAEEGPLAGLLLLVRLRHALRLAVHVVGLSLGLVGGHGRLVLGLFTALEHGLLSPLDGAIAALDGRVRANGAAGVADGVGGLGRVGRDGAEVVLRVLLDGRVGAGDPALEDGRALVGADRAPALSVELVVRRRLVDWKGVTSATDA